MLALERLVFAASPDTAERQALARQLGAALDGQATPEAKRCFCEGLSLLGSASEVPALARALADKDLFDHARLALERIPAEEATGALLAALAAAPGPARAGLIGSLAARRAEMALPELARLAARLRACWGEALPKATKSVCAGLPWVMVPVLSKASQRSLRPSSKYTPPLMRMLSASGIYRPTRSRHKPAKVRPDDAVVESA